MRYLSLCLAMVTAYSSFGAVPETGTLEESAPSETRPFSKIGADLYGWTYSPSVSNINGNQATPDGTAGDPVRIVNQITLHTPLFGSFDLAVTPEFSLQPNQGDRFHWSNPAIGIQGTVVESGGFSYWARYEVRPPLLEASREAGMVASPQAINSINYRFPGTRFEAEAVIVPSVDFFNNGEISAFVYLSPRLYYRINDSWSVVTLAEIGKKTRRGTGLFDFVEASTTNYGLGVRYASQAGRGLWVQPFVNFYPTAQSPTDENVSMASTAHIGVFFGGPLL